MGRADEKNKRAPLSVFLSQLNSLLGPYVRIPMCPAAAVGFKQAALGIDRVVAAAAASRTEKRAAAAAAASWEEEEEKEEDRRKKRVFQGHAACAAAAGGGEGLAWMVA